MVPVAVVVLSPPLTVNGKLDVRALPAPEYQDGDHYRAPANAVEEILASVYAQVLGVERVGVDESFFDLGGDSILAMRLVAAINTSLGAGLSVHAFSTRPRSPSWRPVSAGRRAGLSRWWPVNGPRRCRCRLPKAGCGSLTSCRGHHRCTTWRPRFGSAGHWMSTRWARHWRMWWAATNRCAPYFPTLTVCRCNWSCRPSGTCFGWDVVDATAWPADRLGEAIEETARHTFDLATEIPLRAWLFRVTDDEHVLVGVVHHIAADGWSIIPLVGDLSVAYASRCAGRAPHWPPLAAQYVDYTLWQREQFGDLDDSESLIAAQVAYWQDALAGDARAAAVAH